jgi:di/tricarboxylate transporter
MLTASEQEDAMPRDWWIRKRLVFILAFVVITLVAAGLAFPEPFPGAEIGPEWQCSRVAFVFTICNRVSQADRAIARVAREPVCRRPRA